MRFFFCLAAALAAISLSSLLAAADFSLGLDAPFTEHSTTRERQCERALAFPSAFPGREALRRAARSRNRLGLLQGSRRLAAGRRPDQFISAAAAAGDDEKCGQLAHGLVPPQFHCSRRRTGETGPARYRAAPDEGDSLCRREKSRGDRFSGRKTRTDAIRRTRQ